MTTTKAKNKPAPQISGYTTEEQVYATRYKQGGRTVFGLALTPDQIVNLIQRPDPDAHNPGNRKIRPKHAADFAEYYLDNESWVAPALILRAPSIFSFDADIDVAEGSAQFGILSYPKRAQSEIHILDGQHRILGFHLALQEITNRLEKARDFRARAIRTEQGDMNSAVVREAEKAIRDAEKLRDRFYSERISVEIQVTDSLTEYRQMFYDIAENALGITAAVKARFDNRKVANRALAPVLEHPLLVGRVDIDQDRIGRNSPFLLSAKHVTDIIRSAQVGVDGRIGKIMEKTLNDIDVANTATKFLDLAVEAFPPYQALLAGQVMPEQLRSTGMFGSPAALRMLASVFHDLKATHGFDNDMVLEYFKTLAPHLSDRAHADSIWIQHMPEDAFTVDAYGPDVRRQNIAGAVKALDDWAVLGPQGAPFVWEAPKPAPTPPPTEDDLLLTSDIAKDPELATLLEKRDELEAEMAKAGKVKK